MSKTVHSMYLVALAIAASYIVQDHWQRQAVAPSAEMEHLQAAMVAVEDLTPPPAPDESEQAPRAGGDPESVASEEAGGEPEVVAEESPPPSKPLAELWESDGDAGSWAFQAEDALFEILDREELLGSTLVRATCHRSSCRSEITHVDEEAYETFVSIFPALLPWQSDGQIEVERNHDGSVYSIVYVAEVQPQS